jgi:hypothetical protein
MDASSSIDTENLFGTSAMEGVSPAEAKKAMSAAKLAELALIDPKKAKRYYFCGFLLFVLHVVSSVRLSFVHLNVWHNRMLFCY